AAVAPSPKPGAARGAAREEDDTEDDLGVWTYHKINATGKSPATGLVSIYNSYARRALPPGCSPPLADRSRPRIVWRSFGPATDRNNRDPGPAGGHRRQILLQAPAPSPDGLRAGEDNAPAARQCRICPAHNGRSGLQFGKCRIPFCHVQIPAVRWSS